MLEYISNHNNRIDNNDTHSYMLMSYTSHSASAQYAEISLLKIVVNVWNSLPKNVDFSSLSKFKKLINQVNFCHFEILLMYNLSFNFNKLLNLRVTVSACWAVLILFIYWIKTNAKNLHLRMNKMINQVKMCACVCVCVWVWADRAR